jgi:hypothetical protein
VLSLYFFGGATLQTFALALLVGITSGAYSSIFVAAPLLTMWKEREPEYKRLIGSTEVKGGVGQIEVALEQSEAALAAEPAPATPLDVLPAIEEPEPEPEPAAAGSGDGAVSKSQAKRERRRQRRRSRPHGRAR